MSIELLEVAAQALEPLLDEVVFLGGASLALWITDPGAPPLRPTKDVDVVAEVTTRGAFHAFEERLRSLGFEEDQEDGVICRWRFRESGLILDAMPADAAILGFDNRWQGASIPHAIERALPSGRKIRAAPPAYLLATKLEAFRSAGAGKTTSSPAAISRTSSPCSTAAKSSLARSSLPTTNCAHISLNSSRGSPPTTASAMT